MRTLDRLLEKIKKLVRVRERFHPEKKEFLVLSIEKEMMHILKHIVLMDNIIKKWKRLYKLE